jgi:photosystem II stability/assembly factor-like uncharacterized protein
VLPFLPQDAEDLATVGRGVLRRGLLASLLFFLAFLFPSSVPASTVVSIAIDRDTPTTVFVSNGQVFQSADGGLRWRPTGPGLEGFISKLVSAGGGRWFAATDSTVYRSVDGGASWAPSGSVFGSRIYDLVVAPSSGLALYASWNTGVFSSQDGGESWWPAGGGLPSEHYAQLAVDPANHQKVYAAGREGLYVSSDGGANWEKKAFQLAGVRTGGVLQARIDPNRPATIYISRLQCVLCLFPILERSDDGGDTSFDILGAYPGLVFAIDSASVVVVSTLGELQRSFDRGATWEKIGEGIPSPVVVLAASSVSSLVLAGTQDGNLYSTSDHGSSWRALPVPGPLCGPAELCLGSGRFRISTTFRPPGTARPFGAQSIPMTDNAGGFWFFSPNNVEVVVKVVDGRGVNGHYWVFVGSLSDVAYSVQVKDTETGVSRFFANPDGVIQSQADTTAF